jgi:hypothetical protein
MFCNATPAFKERAGCSALTLSRASGRGAACLPTYSAIQASTSATPTMCCFVFMLCARVVPAEGLCAWVILQC